MEILVFQKFIVGVVLLVVAAVLYRVFFSRYTNSISNYNKMYKEVLTADKYKIKGRFD